jgi:hypothetical protein
MMNSLAIGLLWTLFPLFHLTFAQGSGYITSKPVSRFYISVLAAYERVWLSKVHRASYERINTSKEL